MKVFARRFLPVLLLSFLLLAFVVCKARRIELTETSACPPVQMFQRVMIEGYFDQDSIEKASFQGGYEAVHPYAQVRLSVKPGVKSRLDVAIILAGQGLNGNQTSSRAEYAPPRIRIKDHEGKTV